MKDNTMFTAERHEKIMEILEIERSVSVNRLAETLYVSPPTVRRDLDTLEKQGKVVRTHGGVILRQTAESEIPLMLREEQNNVSKQIIAEKASRLIADGNVIFLDASSTVAYLIPHMKKFSDIIVVTNSPKTSMKLGEARIRSYCTGGLLLNQSMAYVGSEAEKFVASINADLFFFSSRGYTEDGAITDSSAEEAVLKKAMMQNAERTFYLCDSSKRGRKYMYNICRTTDVDGVIDELN